MTTEKIEFTKPIYVERYHVMEGSHRQEKGQVMQEYVGIVLYQQNGQLEWTQNNIKCKAGDIFLYKSAEIARHASSNHGNAFKQAFGVLKTEKTIGIGFSFRKYGEWNFKVNNSGTFSSNSKMHPAEKAKIDQALKSWFADGTRNTSASLTSYLRVHEIRTTNDGSAKLKQPVINSMAWGIMSITFNNPKPLSFKDCILAPGMADNWNWRDDGTHHRPGISKQAVDRIIGKCDIVILTKGQSNSLLTSPETEAYLKEKAEKTTKFEYFILTTPEAVGKYNQLVRANNGLRIGGLFHSTC